MITFRITLLYFFFIPFLMAFGQKEELISQRTALYKALSSDDNKLITSEINHINETNLVEKEAYIGALLMKKASIVSNPKDKLSFFKQGHHQLEKAILGNEKNVEYHFLRLMIQENAPGILGYKSNIGQDKEIIVSSFKTLPQEIQHAILDYSKKSKVLRGEHF